MKHYVLDLLKGVPLAFGALLTMQAVVLCVSGEKDNFLPAFVMGLIGIPVLFASLTRIVASQSGPR